MNVNRLIYNHFFLLLLLDPKAELKKLNMSLLYTYLELVEEIHQNPDAPYMEYIQVRPFSCDGSHCKFFSLLSTLKQL